MQHRFEVTPSCDKLRHLMAYKDVTLLIGGDAALRLAVLGHDVTIAARKPAPAETGMSQLPIWRRWKFMIENIPFCQMRRFTPAEDRRCTTSRIRSRWQNSTIAAMMLPRSSRASSSCSLRTLCPEQAPGSLIITRTITAIAEEK